MTIKSAQDLIEEFVHAVRPPQGCAIVLTEIVPSQGFDFNWLASAGHMSAAVMEKYDSALLETKRQNPRIKLGRRDGFGQRGRLATHSSIFL